ncbi:Zinc finger, C3HC4 type (RING finger) [Musa troglodytarum]|uniref:Zinc finger, C3HC4 type (RING finger) n=1 Tax=Musa troglodytarum TaxID=320322 RepID=A0A9E7EBC3_9LILI|nr:Zinc finger, C3HC4 type (RING finger) [Musa troglodytarum]
MAEPPIQAPSPSSAPDVDEPSSFFMLVFQGFLFFFSVACSFLIMAAVMFLLLAIIRYCDTRQLRSMVTCFIDKIPHGIYVVPSSPSLLPSTSDDIPEHQLDHCVICMEEYAGGEQLWVVPACKHVFHEACIKQWLFKPPLTCPICRVHMIESSDDDDNDNDNDIETPLLVGTF